MSNAELLSFTPEGDTLVAYYKGCRVSIHTPSRPGHREMQAILTIKEGDTSTTTVQYFEGISFAEAAQRVTAWVDQKLKPLLFTELNADINDRFWKDDRVTVEQATKTMIDLCKAASLEGINPIHLNPDLKADWSLDELPKCKDCTSKDTCTLSAKECTAHTDDHERDKV